MPGFMRPSRWALATAPMSRLWLWTGTAAGTTRSRSAPLPARNSRAHSRGSSGSRLQQASGPGADGLDGVAEPGVGRLPDAFDNGQDALLGHGVEQACATLEVVVDHGGRDAGSLGYLGYGRGGLPLVGEEAHRAEENCLPAVCGLGGRGPALGGMAACVVHGAVIN